MNEVKIVAVGDVIIDRPSPETAFAKASEMLKSGDFAFGNCEGVYSDLGARNPVASSLLRCPPTAVKAMAQAGFRVMSYANNHALDWGIEGFLDTIQSLKENGIVVAGAGKDLKEADEPVFIERNGVVVAFVAFTCVFPPGFDATAKKPGCATIKIHVAYEQELGQPGTHPKISTFPDYADLQKFEAAIKSARSRADVVLVSVHWGIHNKPGFVTDYERHLARAAILSGADAVFGHHQHILQGIDMVGGKPVFYGLGNFVCDVQMSKVASPEYSKHLADEFGEYAPKPREGYPTYPFHPEARQTIVLKLTASKKGISKVILNPCVIEPDGAPRPLMPDEKAFSDWHQYIKITGAAAGLDSQILSKNGLLELSL